MGAGSSGKGGAPAPPDFMGAANSQTQANRPNQTGPFGSINWSQDPNTGAWTQSSALNGPLGAAGSVLQNQAAQQAGQPIPTGQQARDQAINAAYGQATSRLDPQFSQMQTSMEAKLANQGLVPGTQAYDAAMQNFGRERNDAYTSAMNSAIGQGTQAGNMLFQQGLQSAELPYQQMQQLQGLGQQPGYHSAADMLGAMGQAYGGSLNQYGANQAQKNSLMNGISGLASTGAMMAMMA